MMNHTQNPKASQEVLIRYAKGTDLPSFVALSYEKRRAYEKAQPQFCRYSGDDAEQSQKTWFKELLSRDDHIMLTATTRGKITGFIIGKFAPAPEVYDPGELKES